MKALGVDYGEKMIGLSISDEIGIVAAPMRALKVTSIADAVLKLQKIAKSQNVDVIVIGLPLGRKGEETKQSIQTRYFANALKETNGIEITFWNEAFSTKAAKITVRKKSTKKKKNLDSEAARIILQEFLDYQKSSRHENTPEVEVPLGYEFKTAF